MLLAEFKTLDHLVLETNRLELSDAAVHDHPPSDTLSRREESWRLLYEFESGLKVCLAEFFEPLVTVKGSVEVCALSEDHLVV